MPVDQCLASRTAGVADVECLWGGSVLFEETRTMLFVLASWGAYAKQERPDAQIGKSGTSGGVRIRGIRTAQPRLLPTCSRHNSQPWDRNRVSPVSSVYLMLSMRAIAWLRYPVHSPRLSRAAHRTRDGASKLKPARSSKPVNRLKIRLAFLARRCPSPPIRQGEGELGDETDGAKKDDGKPRNDRFTSKWSGGG